jgi:Uma2 family endonuclease
MTYLDGELELMSPARVHERNGITIGRLLERWSEEVGIQLEGYGHWTLKKKRVKRGCEADECYCVGRVARDDEDVPDIAIKVVHTRGGISKLEVYRKLGVREVWFFRKGRLAFHALRGTRYEAIERSELLPSLDPALIERCMAEPTQAAAIRLLLDSLRR